MVTYEWAGEIVATEDNAQYAIGDVVDSVFFESAAELREWVNAGPEDASMKLVPLAVRTDSHGWYSRAYLDAAEMPTHFYDASGGDVAKVPARIAREWMSA